METVSREETDTAIVNGRCIFLTAAVIMLPEKLDSVNVFSESSSVKAHTIDGATKGTADVYHTVGILVI